MYPTAGDFITADLGKRHELYAVWIATEIVQATEGHRCTIHHDNGRIEFAFFGKHS